MHIIKWKKPIYKGHILYGPNYITFGKRQSYEDSKRSMIAQGVVGGRQKGLFGQWNYSVWHCCGYTLLYFSLQAHRIYNTESEPYFSLWTVADQGVPM